MYKRSTYNDPRISATFVRIQTTGLLSRGSQVRVLSGALFPKEFASFDREEISRRPHIEKSDHSRDFAPQLRDSRSTVVLSKTLHRDFIGAYEVPEIAPGHRSEEPVIALREGE